ncbi:MAG: hypothetical protein FNNCIFGK_01704 [Bacteroidia bacterium]|nr:hypothetical protein [Bacteroidia bacterium]
MQQSQESIRSPFIYADKSLSAVKKVMANLMADEKSMT